MSINIWYVSKYAAPPGRGTTGGRGFLLMKELTQLGHQVTIIMSDSNHTSISPNLDSAFLFQEVDGVQLCWVRTTKYLVAKSLRRILSWLHFEWRLLWLPVKNFERPDVIIVSSLSLLTLLNGLRWRWLYNCRLIFEIRDIWPLTIVEEGSFSPVNPFVWFLSVIELIGYKYADAIVGTMPNLSEHVQKVLGYPKATHCIPMGIDMTSLVLPKNLSADYEEQYIPKGKFIVAHVGSIGISNALYTFLECAEVMKLQRHIHFILVGDGDLREAYRIQYAHLVNLSFAPQVPKAMVQSVLSKCDLLYFSVHVSKVWKYGQSLNKVIDYMLAGKPIVASYTGYPSMINEAGCGSFVPAGDVSALRHELEHYSRMSANERAEVGARGRAWILANRQYPKLAEDYLKILLQPRNRLLKI